MFSAAIAAYAMVDMFLVPVYGAWCKVPAFALALLAGLTVRGQVRRVLPRRYW